MTCTNRLSLGLFDSEGSFCKKYITLTERIYNFGHRSKTLNLQNPKNVEKSNLNYIKYFHKGQTGQKE